MPFGEYRCRVPSEVSAVLYTGQNGPEIVQRVETLMRNRGTISTDGITVSRDPSFWQASLNAPTRWRVPTIRWVDATALRLPGGQQVNVGEFVVIADGNVEVLPADEFSRLFKAAK